MTTEVKTRDQEMTTGTITTRKKMSSEHKHMEKQRKKVTKETEDSFIGQAHGQRETKNKQRD